MANEKQIKARLQQKHDIEANWNLATNFVPKQGELIVYDKDENYSYERMKIGDGEKTVNALPFIDAQILDENGIIKQNVLPEGYPYATSGEVLPMTSVSINPDDGMGMIVDKFSLVEGAEYEVIWNGTSYTCIAVACSFSGITMICLGNLEFLGEEPTDYPFGLGYITDASFTESTGAYGAVIPYEGLTDVNLSINGTIVYQIDKKFVPTPDVVTNIVNGDNVGSIRSKYAQLNDDEYQIGQSATALGYMTKASGDYSHAEGFYTIASGDYSHVEGYETTASGDCSHAEGYDATASGTYSHAEGYSTEASGESSHAEGFHTTASGRYQHVQGKYNIEDTVNKYAHIVGNGSYGNPSNAHTLDWNGVGWFKSGLKIGGTSQDDPNAECVVLSRDLVQLQKKTGMNVEGKTFQVSGESVVAEAGAEIFNDYLQNIATGGYSHAEGYKTTASGYYSHAEGYLSRAEDHQSHAEGSNTTASNSSSHAEGHNTTASGSISHAEGSGTTASGVVSHAEGHNTTASGEISHAEGYNTTASGIHSHAEGTGTTASGISSHAEGGYTTASSWYSHAEGNHTIASGDSQHAQGKYNIKDTENKYAHIVGNGASDVNRSNAHTLDWNGNAWFAGDVYVGSTSGKDKDAGSKKLVTESDLSTAIARKSQVQIITWEADD